MRLLEALSIHRRLDEIERDLRETREATEAARLGFQKTHEEFRTILDEVKVLAIATNGRVRKVELWRAQLQGAKAAMAWLPTLGCATIGGVIVAAATKLIS